MMPSQMWKGGNTILERSTTKGATALREPGISSLRTGLFFIIIFFYLLQCSCLVVPQTQEARKFCIANLQPEERRNHFEILTYDSYDPLVLGARWAHFPNAPIPFLLDCNVYSPQIQQNKFELFKQHQIGQDLAMLNFYFKNLQLK